MSIIWIDDCFTNFVDQQNDIGGFDIYDDSTVAHRVIEEVVKDKITRMVQDSANYNFAVFKEFYNHARDKMINFKICTFEYAYEHWNEIYKNNNLVFLDIGYEKCEERSDAQHYDSDLYGCYLFYEKTKTDKERAEHFYFLTNRRQRPIEFAFRQEIDDIRIARIPCIPKEPQEIPGEKMEKYIADAIEQYINAQPISASQITWEQWNMLRAAGYAGIGSLKNKYGSKLTNTFPHHLFQAGEPAIHADDKIFYNKTINEEMKLLLSEKHYSVQNYPVYWGENNKEQIWEAPPIRSFFDYIDHAANGKDLFFVLNSLRFYIYKKFNMKICINMSIRSTQPNGEEVELNTAFKFNYLWFNAPALATAIFLIAEGFNGQCDKQLNVYSRDDEMMGVFNVDIEGKSEGLVHSFNIEINQYFVNSKRNSNNLTYYKVVPLTFPTIQECETNEMYEKRMRRAYHLIQKNAGGKIEATGSNLKIKIMGSISESCYYSGRLFVKEVVGNG